MKKKTTFVALLFCSLPLWSTNTVMQDGEPVELPIKVKDGGFGNQDIPRTPVMIPNVAQSNHTLFIFSGCDNTTLELYAEDETLVYTTYIPEGTEQITLLSDLTGGFELRIIRGSITFVAEIEL